VHPGNRRLVRTQAGRGGFVVMPCPAHRRTERCHARRAARRRAHAARTPRPAAAPLSSTARPPYCLTLRAFFRCAPDAPIDSDSPRWRFAPSLGDPKTGPPEPSCRALHFCHPVLAWQAEEAVASLQVRVAVRLHCGHPACAQHGGAHAFGCSSGTKQRVLTGTLVVYHYRVTHGTARFEECAKDLLCCRRGWSCS
jgi:hypothetical protein